MRFDTRLKLGRATLAATLLASGLMAVTAANAGEAPELAAQVAAGTLPALEERLPANPLVVPVVEQIGVYSDAWHSAMVGGADEPWVYRTVSYENLMRWTPDWSGVIPNIAESVDVNDNATEYTFHLREGMKWSDGAPFTSADIQFWYEDLFTDEQFTPAPAEPFINVDGSPVAFEVIDETTFKFTFANPKGLFLQYLATARPLDNATVRYPRHYLEKFHPKYNPNVADEIAAAGADRLDRPHGQQVELYGQHRGADDQRVGIHRRLRLRRREPCRRRAQSLLLEGRSLRGTSCPTSILARSTCWPMPRFW